MKITSSLQITFLKKICLIIALAIFFILFWNVLIFADGPGDLDFTFNTTGIVTTSIGSSTDGGESIAIQPDGRIIVAGGSLENDKFNFAVARYTSTGDLDPNFNDSGIVTSSVGSGFDGAHSVTLQPDSKIVAVGESTDGILNTSIAVVRYQSNGSLDLDFNSTGILTTSIGENAYGRSVAVQSDGKIVVAGNYYQNTSERLAVVRYTITGSLDTSFNNTGIVTTPIGSFDSGNSVAIQDDGKIVVAGNSDSNVAVVRYTPAGKLDTSFNGTGIVTTSIGTSDYGSSVAIQDDGKIVVAGTGDSNFAVARYMITGSLDTEFNHTGIVTTAISNSNDQATAIAIQPDGKLIVVGGSGGNNNFAVTIVRYNRDGSLDTSLKGTGIVTTSVGAGNDAALTVALQKDGKIIVSGITTRNGGYDFVVMRYLGEEMSRVFLPVILKTVY